MISTIDRINDDLTVVVYDCRDLVNLATLDPGTPVDKMQAEKEEKVKPQGGGLGSGTAVAKKHHSEEANDRSARRLPLIQTIIASAAPGAWPEDATISEVGGLLVIRQNPFEHDRIKRLLASIRLMRKEGAFAALSDQYDAEAKKRVADQAVLKARLARVEHELELLKEHTPATPNPAWVPAK